MPVDTYVRNPERIDWPSIILVLVELRRKPGQNCNQLRKKLKRGILGVQYASNKLIRSGFVERFPSKTDRRSFDLFLKQPEGQVVADVATRLLELMSRYPHPPNTECIPLTQQKNVFP